MFSNAAIIPTGNELISGIIKDTDSPAMMSLLLELNPCAQVTRHTPAADQKSSIASSISECVSEGFDLIILIGGSGEGHRHSSILGEDYTHSSMESVLETKLSTKLYGKNGHMWSELVIGTIGDSLIFNVPGPYQEAISTLKAFADHYQIEKKDQDIPAIHSAMVQALKTCYGEL